MAVGHPPNLHIRKRPPKSKRTSTLSFSCSATRPLIANHKKDCKICRYIKMIKTDIVESWVLIDNQKMN